MTTLCTTGTPRFGKSYVRKPSLNSAGKLPGSDKSSSLSVDAESVRTLDLNLPTVNKSNIDINDSFDQMVQDYKSLGNAQRQDAEMSESGDESDDCLNYLFKSLEGDSSSHAIDNPPRREEKDKTKTNSKLRKKSSKPENSKQDQISSETSGTKYDILPTNHSVIEIMESPAKKQKLDIFDKITQEIQSRLSKNPKLVSKKEDSGAKNNPNKEITLETPIVGSGAPVELKLKSNITDTVESIPNKTLECKNHRNDSKSVFSFDGSGSDKFPRMSDGQSSLSDTRHASLTSIKENTSSATQNKPLIKFWYLSSLRCRDKDDKFLSCSSHLVCNECSPLRHRSSHSFPCSPKETCDEECQATVAKLDVGTQSESHLTSKAKRTPIYVETGVQTCVPNKSCGIVDKLDPTSPTCSEIDPANLTRTTSPQETSVQTALLSKTKSTCCENTKPITFASIEKQIQNDNVKNTIVESTDIEFVPETEDNHCTDSEIFSESLAEVMSEDRPNDGKSLSKCSSLHLKPPVGLQRKQNGTGTLPNDSSNGTRIINRSSVNVFAGENKSNICVNFEDLPTQKQSSNANNKHLSSLSDVSTVILSTGEVRKYIKEPEIYSKKKKKTTNVLESGSHLTHNKQMPGKSNCENKVIIDYEVNNTAHSKANKAKAVRHLTFSQNVIPKLTDPSSSIFTEENMTLSKTKSKKVVKRARRISTSSDSGGEIRHEARKRKILKENIPVENETLSPSYKNDHYFENDILSFDSDAMDEDEFMRRAVENCEVSNSLSILPPDASKNTSTSTGTTDGCNIDISVTGAVELSTHDEPRQLGRRNNQLLPNVSLTSSLQALLEPESRINGESTQPHTMEFLEGSQKDDADVCRQVEREVHTNSDQDISSLGPESYLLDTQQQHDMEVKNKMLNATIKECEANLKARMNVEECHMVADSNESEQELNADSEESPTEDFIYPTPQNKSRNRCKQSPTPSKQSSNTTSILNTLNPQQTTDVPTSCRKRATAIDYQPMAGNVKQSTNSRPATIRTPSLPTELCVACSGLTLQDKQKVVHFADFFKLSFSNSYESRVTHLVVPKVVENLRTIKFLFGIAEKKWIVYLDWVTDSIAAHTLLPEERYEALGNDVGPRLSRQTNTPLFQQFEFYFDSLSSGTIDKAQIENLVTICGATVVSHPIKFNLYSGKICMIIIETQDDDLLTRAIELYNEFKAPSFYLDFIIESIAQFAIADCYDYVTLPITKEDFRKFGYPV
uniref:BRCT domain-containing protein n=1 Tax=Timema poppense TaxID=170557 RepID=A0A7R9DIK4_TIMPO|nr:unnamed protein product [Timema poppensis]